MKFLINLCAHDGIVSHYTGVGTMVKRYIKLLPKYFKEHNIDYTINLISPEYKSDSFGFNNQTKSEHEKDKNLHIILVSNGTNGNVNYGKPEHWKKLCNNTANLINNLNLKNYDMCFTICNDTPFANLAKNITNLSHKHKFIWIPHSTVLIQDEDSCLPDYKSIADEKLEWERESVNVINNTKFTYLACISKFIKKHMIDEYGLNQKSAIDLHNGEILDEKTEITPSKETKQIFEELNKYNKMIISFGRAESYKNLEFTINLQKYTKIKTVVIAQSYYKEQPILDVYRNLARQSKATLLIDPPFELAKYITQNFSGKLVVLLPSKRETFGLIPNEVRKLNKDNILVVSNDIDGVREQIEDMRDGILIKVDDLTGSAKKIEKFLDDKYLTKFKINGYKTLIERYDLYKNLSLFLEKLQGEDYE